MKGGRIYCGPIKIGDNFKKGTPDGIFTMTSSEDMPRADLSDEKLKNAQAYAKYLEHKNYMRSLYGKRILRRKRFMAGFCCAFVVGVYCFTLFRVQQEAFLDDFEEPPRVNRDEKN